MRFAAYRSACQPFGVIGLVSGDDTTIQPVLFPNSSSVTNLHHLIAHWDQVKDSLLPGGPQEDLNSVELLAPLPGRDVLCVGKNYQAHAEEFHSSGYDSSDKKAQPDYPVIFTKRATSIIGHNQPIYPHPSVTQSLDYEGELGIIIGKAGSQITKENAWDYIWGATIINDMTARERQRDHKQFYIGKSLDTFCPMGPWAVHVSDQSLTTASALDFNNMILETRVNGEVRQKQDTKELIFDIPTLIEVCSMGITLQPGDIIATGTPAGVGLSNGSFLSSGDKIDVSITGLGTLSNYIDLASAPYPKCEPLQTANVNSHSFPDDQLIKLPSGSLHVEVTGNEATNAPVIAFIHGLGGSSRNFDPMISVSQLDSSHKILQFDLEGHGLSPLSGQRISVPTYANSIKEVLNHFGVKQAVLVAHSLGGLIANTFAAANPKMVSKLVLIGPVKQFPEAGYKALTSRAETVRKGGMSAVAQTIVKAGTSEITRKEKPLVAGYILSSLLSTNAEGYAQACVAAAAATDPAYGDIDAETLILAGSEDKTAPSPTIEYINSRIGGSKVVQIEGVGHWHMLEDHDRLGALLATFVHGTANGH